MAYDFHIGKASDISSRSASWTRRRDADGKPISDRVVPASPVLFVPEELTPLSTIQVQVHQ